MNYKGLNTPEGFDDPANNERPFEPNLQEYRELVWKYIKSNKEKFIDFVESQEGESNKHLLSEWVDCDYNENVKQ